ncbi:sodium:calcium antiporter [Jeotgalibacillus proteolyticus]|uniref:Cation transporter n=1 Tax=Jeotgalibacillus proteolyticus TaxID=2082395 RepID=A0A2S5GCJ9_9BACL|nr:sodium:calcium antiporter [Jeotgalibacillus proteolyticus]PPA70678.1 cation transporter [Jeotgalibacillus proteolyticus]
MVFVWFILAAAVTVFAAVKLSRYADIISSKTAMGGLMVGTLLLAGATSLPEVTTSVSAVLIGNVDIAVGNMLGSNLFNLFIIACFDLYFRKKRLYHWASKDHLYTAGLGLLLTILTLIALIVRIDYPIWDIGIDAFIIAFTYIIGVFVISRLPKSTEIVQPHVKEEATKPEESSLTAKQAIFRFVIAAIGIMAAGTALSITGDRIAVVTGMGSSFVGSFLIAATTSLPEAIAVFIALKLRNVNLALGSILGSNIFNMLILAGSDFAYREGSILADVSSSHIVTSIAVAILSIILLYSVSQKKPRSTIVYVIPSVLIIIGYFVSSYLIFNG